MTVRRIVAALGLIALLYWASGWLFPKKDDRAYLLAFPGLVATLVEEGKAGEVKKFLSEQYSDSSGRNYNEINRMIMAQVLAGGAITIFTLGPRVEIDASGTRATLLFRAAMARGKRNPGIIDIPAAASFWDFSLELDKSSGSWLVTSGMWSQG